MYSQTLTSVQQSIFWPILFANSQDRFSNKDVKNLSKTSTSSYRDVVNFKGNRECRYFNTFLKFLASQISITDADKNLKQITVCKSILDLKVATLYKIHEIYLLIRRQAKNISFIELDLQLPQIFSRMILHSQDMYNKKIEDSEYSPLRAPYFNAQERKILHRLLFQQIFIDFRKKSIKNAMKKNIFLSYTNLEMYRNEFTFYGDLKKAEILDSIQTFKSTGYAQLEKEIFEEDLEKFTVSRARELLLANDFLDAIQQAKLIKDKDKANKIFASIVYRTFEWDQIDFTFNAFRLITDYNNNNLQEECFSYMLPKILEKKYFPKTIDLITSLSPSTRKKTLTFVANLQFKEKKVDQWLTYANQLDCDFKRYSFLNCFFAPAQTDTLTEPNDLYILFSELFQKGNVPNILDAVGNLESDWAKNIVCHFIDNKLFPVKWFDEANKIEDFAERQKFIENIFAIINPSFATELPRVNFEKVMESVGGDVSKTLDILNALPLHQLRLELLALACMHISPMQNSETLKEELEVYNEMDEVDRREMIRELINK